ncbi:hypothetical protein C1I92_32860 [Jiangella anatolica]|uniref:ATP/GTP-binding protein n=1 Tax=Jiangella anatolica TaxID=2670374 RepID=A0A2W2BFU9_9ACTN|nr:hypothetical protein C1I92_32860 [Jiangella anatolica]
MRASPECGYVYEQTSGDWPGAAYEITATANWVVTWAASGGETGTLEGARPTTAARVRIGERQVIETG